MNLYKWFLIILLFISVNVRSQKVVIFSELSFDSSTSIVCLPSKSNPQQYSFLIKSKRDFESLKKSWIFSERDYHGKPENSLGVFVIKNKVGEWIASIYPSITKLITANASYLFDTSLLSSLSRKHPFHFRTKEEVFQSRREYLIRYDQYRGMKNYLFSFGPGTWDGTFKIVVTFSDSIKTPVQALDLVNSKLTSISDPSNFSLRYELIPDIGSRNKSILVTVDCLESVYLSYNDRVFKKINWRHETISMTSFWKQ